MRNERAPIVLPVAEAIKAKSKLDPDVAALAPLVRLRQIVEELRAAANRNDLVVVQAAAALLGPTVARCLESREAHPESAREAAEIAKQIEALLQECESLLIKSRSAVADQIKRIQKGKRAIEQARNRQTVLSSRYNISN